MTISAFAVVILHTFIFVFQILYLSLALGCRANGCESLIPQQTVQLSGNEFPHSLLVPFVDWMMIRPYSDQKSYYCIRPVGGATFSTGIFAGIFNPWAFTNTTGTGTLVWAQL